MSEGYTYQTMRREQRHLALDLGDHFEPTTRLMQTWFRLESNAEADEIMRLNLRRWSIAILAFHQPDVVAFAGLWYSFRKKGEALYDMAYVKPEHRQHGIFTEMTTMMIAESQAMGLTSLRFESEPPLDIPGNYMSTLRRMGFRGEEIWGIESVTVLRKKL